jgi:hypothetical protein
MNELPSRDLARGAYARIGLALTAISSTGASSCSDTCVGALPLDPADGGRPDDDDNDDESVDEPAPRCGPSVMFSITDVPDAPEACWEPGPIGTNLVERWELPGPDFDLWPLPIMGPVVARIADSPDTLPAVLHAWSLEFDLPPSAYLLRVFSGPNHSMSSEILVPRFHIYQSPDIGPGELAQSVLGGFSPDGYPLSGTIPALVHLDSGSYSEMAALPTGLSWCESEVQVLDGTTVIATCAGLVDAATADAMGDLELCWGANSFPLHDMNAMLIDLDRDGEPELLVSHGVYSLAGAALSCFPSEPITVIPAELDGDPDLEILGSVPGGIVALELDGTELWFAEVWDAEEGDQAFWLGASADIDGNGRSDVVFQSGRRLFAVDDRGSVLWSSEFSDSGGSLWGGPVITDLQGDGRLEVLAAANEELAAVDALTGVKVARSFTAYAHGHSNSLAIADLDGDNIGEILVPGPDDGIVVFGTYNEGPYDVEPRWERLFHSPDRIGWEIVSPPGQAPRWRATHSATEMPVPAPDLALVRTEVCELEVETSGELVFYFGVANLGQAEVTEPIGLALGDSLGGWTENSLMPPHYSLLASGEVQADLVSAAGGMAVLELRVPAEALSGFVLDELWSGVGLRPELWAWQFQECRFDNNWGGVRLPPEN